MSRTPRILDGILHHARRRTVSYAELQHRLNVMPPSLTRALRLLAQRGEVVLLDRHHQPLNLRRRCCTRFVTAA